MSDEGDKDKVPVIEWSQYGVGDEPVMVYRVDHVEDGVRFFQHLRDNAECDGRERFEFKVYSHARWLEVCERSKDV